MSEDCVVVDHRFDGVDGELFDFLDFVAGTESIEEVDEGDAGFERDGRSDQGHIVGFLDGVTRQQAYARLAAGHHVGVIAENRQGLARQRSGRDVEAGRRQFAGELVECGDHQQQALASGERRHQ